MKPKIAIKTKKSVADVVEKLKEISDVAETNAEDVVAEVLMTTLAEKEKPRDYYAELTDEQKKEYDEIQARAKLIGFHLVKTRISKSIKIKPKSSFAVVADEGKEFLQNYCVRNNAEELKTMPEKHFPVTKCRKYIQLRDMIYDSIPLKQFIEMIIKLGGEDLSEFYDGRTQGPFEINVETGTAIYLPHKGAIPREDAPLPPNPRVYVPAFIPLLKEMIENNWTCAEYVEELKKDETPRTVVLNKSWESFIGIFNREERADVPAIKVASLSLIILHREAYSGETHEDIRGHAHHFFLKSMSHTLMFGLHQVFSPFKRLSLIGVTGRKRATVKTDELGDL